MSRHVKGSLFVDYVRMLRARKNIDWTKHLLAEDLPFLLDKIDLEGWYPMDTFARFGLAILDEITHGESFPAREWGRMSLEHMVTMHDGLLVERDPRESLMRLLVVRGSFFDFDPVIMPELADGHATVQVNYGMTARAEQAACYQTIGFFGRLVELAGGRAVTTRFTQRSWEGDPVTAFTVDWEAPQ